MLAKVIKTKRKGEPGALQGVMLELLNVFLLILLFENEFSLDPKWIVNLRFAARCAARGAREVICERVGGTGGVRRGLEPSDRGKWF